MQADGGRGEGGRPHRKLEPADIILPPSHAKMFGGLFHVDGMSTATRVMGPIDNRIITKFATFVPYRAGFRHVHCAGCATALGPPPN